MPKAVHLIAAITVRRATLRLAAAPDEKGSDQNNLGNALQMLGERESGMTRLEQAVNAFRDALRECSHVGTVHIWSGRRVSERGSWKHSLPGGAGVHRDGMSA
jgi:hypothetical protein